MTTRTRSDSTTGSRTSGGQGTTGIGEAAGNVADEAGRTLERSAVNGMTQVGEALHGVARAARETSDSLSTEQPQVGRYLTTAATKLDEVADYVMDHEPTELLDQAQSLARRQPALVIGAGLVAGLMAGRLLKSAGGQDGRRQPDTSRSWINDRAGQGSGVSSGYGTGYGTSYHQQGSAQHEGSQRDPSRV